MITQNPITGRAKKKLSGIYARTLYGKNIVQTCPPSTKGKQTPNQVAASAMFGQLSKMSNQIPTSLLNFIFYSAPQGRSRRGEWCKQLASGIQKDGDVWQINPQAITKLGGNPKATEATYTTILAQTSLRVAFADLSIASGAVTNETPCVILVCPNTNQCISLLPYTSIDNDDLVFSNLSETLVGQQIWLFPLWKVNVGTQANPIYTYGSFIKNN